MPTKPKQPHRLTLSEIVERQLAAAHTNGVGESSSVKLVLNARGMTQVEVKVSTSEPGAGGTVEGARAIAEALYDALLEKYAPIETTA